MRGWESDLHSYRDKEWASHHSAADGVVVLLWRSLKKSGVGAKFRRQHGVGPYVLDFYCPEHKLAIEIEGSVHDDVIRRDYDAERQAYLESHGIRVLYFENRALLELSDYVVGVIRSAVLEPPPRLRALRWLRDIFLIAAATPPGQEGRWRSP